LQPNTLKEDKEADDFAKDFAIPKDKYDEFIARGDFTQKGVEKFSNSLEIPSFMVIGRLKKEEKIPREKYNTAMPKVDLPRSKKSLNELGTYPQN
jgi:Zn-dependent peptidase ImmA (M78 family)